jgi:hypothetical protein
MFNAATIQSGLSGLIGFKQHYNTAYDRYDSNVSSALSGIYIDGTTHSLFTVENIAACAENFSKTDVVSYDSAVTYQKGDVVKSVNIIYESLVDTNINHTPASSSSYWVVTNLMSAYLRRLLNGSCLNLFNSVFAHRKLYEISKTLLSDVSLYEGVGNLAKKVTKLSRFVGYRINPTYPDTVINISHIGFQFDTVDDDFNLYVYHSSLNTPLATINFNLTKAISFQWESLTNLLSLYTNSSATNTKGRFYIGYFEDDLAGQAIWKEQLFSGSGCDSCNNLDSYLYKQWSKYFSIQPIYVENAWLSGTDMFDEEKVIELSNQNWGLNLRVQVNCDVSDLIVRNKFAFVDGMKKQLTHDLLRDMAYSLRDNQKMLKVSQLAHYALENKENKTKGIIEELEDAVKSISLDMSGLSKVCLPCENAGNGMTYRGMFS